MRHRNAKSSLSPQISVVCPCWNEEDNVGPLTDGLATVLGSTGLSYEIILVDDGSSDSTWSAISIAASSHKLVRGIRLSRNFDHQRALLAGLSEAKGAAVISMDSDLQHPPELIPQLISAWNEGYKIVTTQRQDKYITSTFKRVTSEIFYRVFSLLAGIKIEPGASDFRLLDRQVLDLLLEFAHQDKFLRGSVQWMGFNSITIPYEAAKRFSGRSKYDLLRMIRFATVAITSFSNRPLRFGIWLGMIVGMLALAELFYVLFIAFSGETVPGWASTVGILSFLFAILFIIVGIIGIYISRIYSLLQNRPKYIIAEKTEATRGEE